MIALRGLQGQVKHLVDDLRQQVTARKYTDLLASPQAEHTKAREAKRTAGTFETWLEDMLDQAAVAWVLSCIFVRFCEDNRLIPRIWIGGPNKAATVERAVQERQGYLIANPLHNDRHWLREAFRYMAGLGPTAKIFDQRNLVWGFDISGAAAEQLSDFFRRGDGYASLYDPELDTRFLGDLYQNLSVHARETYALLQTPDFVQKFILDRTFEPAYKEFGLAGTTVIDPTCGSGHFLLGAFNRLIERWKQREPNTEPNVLVQRALDQVTGVDINPFAVTIARFRLMIAALNACGQKELENARAFKLRLATGDSLLEWGEKSRHQGDLIDILEGGSGFAYLTEDADLLANYLRIHQYAVVVGNPPYIKVNDAALSEKYRSIYPDVCYKQYRLVAPFARRFFDLAIRSDSRSGWVGQITDSAFMKREWGRKLITSFLAREVLLLEVIDSSGAFIPGHGTPTVMLIGRNSPVNTRFAPAVRMIMGVKGEPSKPKDAREGVVWRSIVDLIDRPGENSEWISSADVPRDRLSSFPWSLQGGGANELKSVLEEAASTTLKDLQRDSGNMLNTREDDAYDLGQSPRFAYTGTVVRPVVEGSALRDYGLNSERNFLFPYDDMGNSRELQSAEIRMLWPSGSLLRIRKSLSGTQQDRGLPWYEYSNFTPRRYGAERLLTFTLVATVPHFALRRASRALMTQAVTVISLEESSSLEDYLGLLGVLNSSTACFWLKQVSQSKAGSGIGRGIQPEAWMDRYEFTGTKLEEFPLPSAYPLGLAAELDERACRLVALSPAAIAKDAVPAHERLAQAREWWLATRARMIALQEELDWEVYRLYGLTDEALTVVDVPEIKLGERAFEIVLARKVADGGAETQWFARHGSIPITELPWHWSPEYRAVVEKRIAVIESDRNIGLIEQPECKRRWSTSGWDALQEEALRGWLLNRLEGPELWTGVPTPLSVAQLADRVRHDEDFRSVLDLWVGSDQHDLTRTLGKLVADEHVPYLPLLRYKPAGLPKRLQWERTWEMQRREDAGETVKIDVPPKYASGDFLKASYWRNRGKLDVPKERFVSYPNLGRDGDSTLLLGWAGWDHLAQAQAIATVYLDRKTAAGWVKERRDGLLALLAGLAELEPWLTQWFDEPRPGFNGSPAQFFTGFIDGELAILGADRADLDQLRYGSVS
jgi:hypothetical protein